ncbi:unnamed protein product, partial [Amoebophrya sp. A25]
QRRSRTNALALMSSATKFQKKVGGHTSDDQSASSSSSAAMANRNRNVEVNSGGARTSTTSSSLNPPANQSAPGGRRQENLKSNVASAGYQRYLHIYAAGNNRRPHDYFLDRECPTLDFAFLKAPLWKDARLLDPECYHGALLSRDDGDYNQMAKNPFTRRRRWQATFEDGMRCLAEPVDCMVERGTAQLQYEYKKVVLGDERSAPRGQQSRVVEQQQEQGMNINNTLMKNIAQNKNCNTKIAVPEVDLDETSTTSAYNDREQQRRGNNNNG